MADQQPGQPIPEQDDSNTGKEVSSPTPGKAGEGFTAGNFTPEIATNDGSIAETLDTVFHGSPGWSEGENPSGSSRADYYEARSNGKSDSQEELDEIRDNANKREKGRE